MIKNDSLIPAPYAAFMQRTKTNFEVDITEGTLAPGEEVELTITSCLDDILPHKDHLVINVAEGEDVSVELKARGIGTTLFCKEDLTSFHFGHQFTSNECEHVVLIENRGRRPQQLSWINDTIRQKEAERKQKQVEAAKAEGKAKGGPGGGKKKNEAEDNVPLVPVFCVEPESVELKPFQGCYFRFYGFTGAPGEVRCTCLYLYLYLDPIN